MANGRPVTQRTTRGSLKPTVKPLNAVLPSEFPAPVMPVVPAAVKEVMDLAGRLLSLTQTLEIGLDNVLIPAAESVKDDDADDFNGIDPNITVPLARRIHEVRITIQSTYDLVENLISHLGV